MTEDEAQTWLHDRFGARIFDRLRDYSRKLVAANASQNLISEASEPVIWNRHILDSAQLLTFAPLATNWLDIGSGAGLPGLVLALVTEMPVLLVEPRRKRVDFLCDLIAHFELEQCAVHQGLIEKVQAGPFDAVTARAFAPLPKLISSTVQLTTSSTVWVLPKGRSAERELEAARQAWQGVFHVEQSLSDPEARIIVATAVRAR